MVRSIRQKMNLLYLDPESLRARPISQKVYSINHYSPSAAGKSLSIFPFSPSTHKAILERLVKTSKTKSLGWQRLHYLSAGGTVIDILHPAPEALGVDQAAAAGQRDRLPGSRILQADLARRLVLEQRIFERAEPVPVPPPEHLPLLPALLLRLALTPAPEAEEEVHEDGAGEERDVGVGDEHVVAVMLEHPVLALQLGLAGQRALAGAATVRINLEFILRGTDGRAGEIGGALRSDFALVERDGSCGVDCHGQQGKQYGVDNSKDDLLFARGGSAGRATAANRVEVADFGGGVRGFHSLLVNNNQQYYNHSNQFVQSNIPF